MAVYEEHRMPNADSPDLSVPSATAASYSSSPESFQENDDENSSVRRTLFKMNSEVDSPLKSIPKTANFVLSPKISSVGQKSAQSPSGDENGVVETGSTTSSQTTAIPAWNLSMKDTAEKNVEVPLNHFVLSRPIPLLASPISFSSDRTQNPSSSSSSSSERSHPLEEDESQWAVHSTTLKTSRRAMDREHDYDEDELIKQPSVVMEDPPEAPTSCNAALNLKPVQLAEMFLAFGQSARQRYQGSEQPTATFPENSSPIKVVDSMTEDETIGGSPPPIMKSSYFSDSSSGSNRSQHDVEFSRVRSLERELGVLKNKSQRDAQIISKLKEAIDSQKKLNPLKEVEITDKHTDIKFSEERIKTLEKEQEDFVQRETDLVETIEILKNELDKLTSLKAVPSDELDNLKLESVPDAYNIENNSIEDEITLEASQVKVQHDRIAELENALKEKEKENYHLVTKIDWLSSHQNGETPEKENDPTTNPNVPSKTEDLRSVEVECLLKDIMKRLEVMENEKDGETSYQIGKSGNTVEESKTIHKARSIESEHNGVEVNISEDTHAIEAMSVKGKPDNGKESANEANWCCDWSSLIAGE
eukprot:jgi/Psemu1/69380/estExt_Genemark1.C_8310013